MEPVWLFGVEHLKWTLPLKGHVLSSRDSSFPGLYFVQKFLLHHLHHWPNQKQRIMVCFSPWWVGLIWIADVKIPQDVLKTISGHVVTKKWHVENVVSMPILFQRIFLGNPHNNKMSYKYLHLIRSCIFPFIQSCTRVLVSALTQQFNRIFVPFVFCLSEFCMNIFISIFTQYCPHFTFKKLIKNCTWSVII